MTSALPQDTRSMVILLAGPSGVACCGGVWFCDRDCLWLRLALRFDVVACLLEAL